MEINDGGPAFPVVETAYSGRWDGDSGGYANTCSVGGMSLRDWFAGQALAGAFRGDSAIHDAYTCMRCYELADAMLKAREGK